MKTNATLFLTVKQPYYDEIKSEKKLFEYREVKEYWVSRITHKKDILTTIEIRRDYNHKMGDPDNIVRPWKGYDVIPIVHPHFGNKETLVFAIKVN